MKDNIILSDESGQIVVNLHSYCEFLKWLIVEYVGVSYEEANSCIEQHLDFFDNFDITIMRVALESHSWPYYYLAMDFYFGDHRKATTIKPPPDTKKDLDLYIEIENRILNEHNLKEPFVYYFQKKK